MFKKNDVDGNAITRGLFRSYSFIFGSLGLFTVLWGPMFLHLNFCGEPFASGAVIRLMGAVLIAAACAGEAVAQIPDPTVRRRACGWFALGHGVVGVVVWIQAQSTGIALTPAWPLQVMYSLLAIFMYSWLYPEGRRDLPIPVTTIFSRSAEDRSSTLHSRYEEQIRLAAAQEERHRLARDLHDSVKQQLFVIQTSAATAQARLRSDDRGAQDAIEHVRGASREALTEMQAMLDQLQAAPLENTGLVEALKKQCEALGFRTGASVHLDMGEMPDSKNMSPGSQDALFRVAQEALSNVARHARATNVWVSLGATAGEVTLRIRDDGAGFDTNKSSAGMGLANMKRRARDFGGTGADQRR